MNAVLSTTGAWGPMVNVPSGRGVVIGGRMRECGRVGELG